MLYSAQLHVYYTHAVSCGDTVSDMLMHRTVCMLHTNCEIEPVAGDKF